MSNGSFFLFLNYKNAIHEYILEIRILWALSYGISFLYKEYLMDTFTQLQKHWKPKHFKHLQYCLKYCQAYFEDRFEYQGVRKKGLMVDGTCYPQKKVLEILAEYYDDASTVYQTSFGDAVYLFFTDLVEDDVDILSELDEDVA